MTDYRRSIFCGGTYFFTVVTYNRVCFLTDDLARMCLRSAWRHVRGTWPFEVIALCLLPDHLHCLWQLPEDDNDFSTRWLLIKKGFTRRYLEAGGREFPQSQSRLKKRERAYGRGASGNIKYETNATLPDTSITSTTIQSSTDWSRPLTIGRGRRTIVSCAMVSIATRY
jgi:REP element-mobilizing transposase RayT